MWSHLTPVSALATPMISCAVARCSWHQCSKKQPPGLLFPNPEIRLPMSMLSGWTTTTRFCDAANIVEASLLSNARDIPFVLHLPTVTASLCASWDLATI